MSSALFRRAGSTRTERTTRTTRLGNACRALALFALACAALPLSTPVAHAERLKDLVSIQGVRDNPLIGYGLVVGLDGTGDQTTQTPLTTQSLTNMLGNLGITLNAATPQNMQLKNVAAVMLTAVFPPFARQGE